MKNKEKFELMVKDALKKFFDDIHKYNVEIILKKAELYKKSC